MDNSQIELADKIYKLALESDGLPDLMFAQSVLEREDQSDPRKNNEVKKIVEVLVYQGLLTSTPKK